MKSSTRPSSKSEAAYVNSLINQPWDRKGDHCWALCVKVQRDLFGRELPVVLDVAPSGREGRELKASLFRGHAERHKWMESEPVHGALVLMRRAAAREQMISHSGVYLDLDGGGVLHSDAPHGVVFDTLVELQTARRWAVVSFLVPKP